MTASRSNYRIDLDGDITIITVFDTLNFADVKEMLSKLAEDNIYHFRCIDVSRVTVAYSKDEVMGLSEHSKAIFKDKNRSAIIVGDDLAYGIIRSLIAYREEDAHMQMNVFRTKTDGIAWLHQQKERIRDVNQG